MGHNIENNKFYYSFDSIIKHSKANYVYSPKCPVCVGKTKTKNNNNKQQQNYISNHIGIYRIEIETISKNATNK